MKFRILEAFTASGLEKKVVAYSEAGFEFHGTTMLIMKREMKLYIQAMVGYGSATDPTEFRNGR